MKNPIPTPLIVVIVVVVVAVAGFFLLQAGTVQEYKAPPVTGRTPQHILDAMTPEQRERILAEERKMGIPDGPRDGQQGGAPPADGSRGAPAPTGN